jgi:hypothetical protein
MKTIKNYLKPLGGFALLSLALIASSCSTDEVETTETAITKAETTEKSWTITETNILSNFKIQLGTTEGSTSTTTYTTFDNTTVDNYTWVDDSTGYLWFTMDEGEDTRVELRGITEYDYDGDSYMQFKAKVTSDADGQSICQLHCDGTNDQQFWMLMVQDGHFYIKQNSHDTDSGNTELKVDVDNLTSTTLGFSNSHWYKITMVMEGGKLYISIYDETDKDYYEANYSISSTNFGPDGYYYKLGAYMKTDGTCTMAVKTLYQDDNATPPLSWDF